MQIVAEEFGSNEFLISARGFGDVQFYFIEFCCVHYVKYLCERKIILFIFKIEYYHEGGVSSWILLIFWSLFSWLSLQTIALVFVEMLQLCQPKVMDISEWIAMAASTRWEEMWVTGLWINMLFLNMVKFGCRFSEFGCYLWWLQLCDGVGIARLLNATLVLPKFEVAAYWNEHR